MIKQRLNDKILVGFIAFLGAFIPASTDLYLPALPGMVKDLSTSSDLVNLTLVLFFVFFSAGILIWGPISDKVGRKPILTIGLIIYILASVFSALSNHIMQLIVSRIIQAIGAGAVTAVSVAMIKDLFEGRKRERALAWVQSMIIVVPIVAPILGAFVLSFLHWEFIFWILAIFGVLGLVFSFWVNETLEEKNNESFFRSIMRLTVVLKNPGFYALLIIFSLLMIPMMAYLAASSYIFVDFFGLSERSYSYYFALNGGCAILGPIMYMRLSKNGNRDAIISISLGTMILSGIGIVVFGVLNPLSFALSVLPATILGSLLRIPGTNLMLEQQSGDTGAASSLINAGGTLFGSLGMTLVALNWSNMVVAIGTLTIIIALLSFMGWMVIRKKDVAVLAEPK